MSDGERAYAGSLDGRGSVPMMPPLALRELPGLASTLTGPIDPRRCRACGAGHTTAAPFVRWVECDPYDHVPANPMVVVLCKPCGDRLIDPHPRLYKPLDALEPFPGCMSVCLHCTHRVGTSCRSPAAKANGGPGLVYGWADGREPTLMHVCGTRGGRRTGWRVTVWPGRVLTCSGHAVAQLVHETDDAERPDATTIPEDHATG